MPICVFRLNLPEGTKVEDEEKRYEELDIEEEVIEFDDLGGPTTLSCFDPRHTGHPQRI